MNPLRGHSADLRRSPDMPNTKVAPVVKNVTGPNQNGGHDRGFAAGALPKPLGEASRQRPASMSRKKKPPMPSGGGYAGAKSGGFDY